MEDHDVKAGLLGELNAILDPEAMLASTTSSLSVRALAQAAGGPSASWACTCSTRSRG